MHENKSFNRNPANHALYHALMKALIEDENAMDKGVADIGKKTKRRRTKESESSKKPSTTTETSKGKAPSKSSKTSKSATAKEPIEEPTAEVEMDDAVNTTEDVVHDANQPHDDSTQAKDKDSMQNWFKQPLRPPTPDPEWNKRQDPLTFDDLMAIRLTSPNKLDWNNSKGDRFPFDLTKLLLLKGRPGHLTVAAEYFFNNDLEFLKSFNLEKKYTTYITKTKAARYEIVGIQDMTPTLWSTIKHAIIVKKLHGYGNLEGIVVKRTDRQLYRFKECDFVDLHLNYIEDILLLAVQHKLFHLDGSDIVNFIVALRMFTRSLIIKRRVEDLQLGELYIPSHKPPGVIYEDLNKQKWVMRADELYKFSYGTLKTVRDALHHRILNFRLGYNDEMSRRKWTAIDERRSELMVELLDKQMRERLIIRNLKRLVGAWELEMDYKLMTRTI
ncbi:hypothetical protein Tco_0538238 [Tanacetum coccineum]